MQCSVVRCIGGPLAVHLRYSVRCGVSYAAQRMQEHDLTHFHCCPYSQRGAPSRSRPAAAHAAMRSASAPTGT